MLPFIIFFRAVYKIEVPVDEKVNGIWNKIDGIINKKPWIRSKAYNRFAINKIAYLTSIESYRFINSWDCCRLGLLDDIR